MTAPKASIIAALITAAASILGTLLATDFFKDDETQIEISEKPLNGVWEYDVRFSKFHGIDKEFDSDGFLVLLWDEANGQYDVYHNYTINRSWQINEKVVTGFGTGVLAEVNSDGWPDNPFSLELDYIGRTGIEEFKSPGSTSYTLKDLMYKTSDDGKKIESIKGVFHFINENQVTTKGDIKISRKK